MGQSDVIAENLGLFVTVMRLVNSKDLIGKILAVILNQGKIGQQVAIKLLEEHSGLKRKMLLNAALYYPGVVRRVIIPMLLEDIGDKSLPVSRRNQAATLLSRLGILLEDDSWAELLGSYFKAQICDSSLIASCLVTGGQACKKQFLALMKEPLAPKLTASLCMFMREMKLEPVLPTLVIQIKQEFTVGKQEIIQRHSWHLEGDSFARIRSAPQQADFPEEPFMSLTAQEAEAIFRKFLLVSADQRFSLMCHFQGREKLLVSYNTLFYGATMVEERRLPKQIINVLIDKLDDEESTVREATLSSLGTIGMPSIEPYLAKIENCLVDKNVKVRAMAIWAIGSFGNQIGKKQLEKVLHLLDDSHLQIGVLSPEECLAKLLKILKEGKINRDTVCETIMTFPNGPQVLMEASKANRNSHHVIRSIVAAWKIIDPESPIAETIIREVIEESSFLHDPCPEVRRSTREALISLGHFGRFVMIEGLRKEKLATVRAECVFGLAAFGVLSIRPIIIAMADPEEKVWQAADRALSSLNPQDVAAYFDHNRVDLLPLGSTVTKLLAERGPFSPATTQLLEFLLETARD